MFVAIVVGMYALAAPYFGDVRHAIGMATYQDLRKGVEPPPALGDRELAELLASRRPISIAAVGLVGIVVLVYLMMVKPF